MNPGQREASAEPGGRVRPFIADEISLRPHIEALWRYRNIILVGLAVTVALFAVGLSTSFLLSRVERLGSIQFRLLFQGAEEGTYPDGTSFTPSEIVAAPVLTEVFRANGLDRFGRYESFKKSMFVLQSNPELDLLAYQYEARLADTRITAADRLQLEEEFRAKRGAINDPTYSLSMLRQERLMTLPRDLMQKILLDTLAVWARQAAERKGATGFGVRLLSRNILQESVLDTEDHLVAIDVLRVKAQRLRRAVDELDLLPGARNLRAGARNVSLPEVRANLDDIDRFAFEPLLGLIRSQGVTKNARTLALYANNQYFQLKLEANATAARIGALRDALREYASPGTAGAAGSGADRAERGRSPAAPQAGPGPFGESFLDRLVEMSTQAQTSDVAYRQRLTDQIIAHSQRLSFLDKETAYYEELGQAVRQMGGGSNSSPETLAFIRTRSRSAFDALAQATDDVMAIHAEMEKHTLNPSTLLYAITGPFVVHEQPPLSARTVTLYFVLVMLSALVVIPAACLIHAAFRRSGPPPDTSG